MPREKRKAEPRRQCWPVVFDHLPLPTMALKEVPCPCKSCMERPLRDRTQLVRLRPEQHLRDTDIVLGHKDIVMVDGPGTHLEDVVFHVLLRGTPGHGGFITVTAPDVTLTRVSVIVEAPNPAPADVACIPCMAVALLVTGQGVKAVDCKVLFRGPPQPRVRTWGFAASYGGRLELRGCSVSGGCTYGIRAIGPKSHVAAHGCVVGGGAQHGLSVSHGADLVAGPGCVVVDARRSGMLADNGGRLFAGEGCTVSSRDLGFVAYGGTMCLGSGCTAEQSAGRASPTGTRRIGYVVDGPAGRMAVGARCRAGGFRIGFACSGGAVMKVGTRTAVVGPAERPQSGFASAGFVNSNDGRDLRIGDACSARGVGMGFLTTNGGRTTAGERCEARDCKYGFYCSERGVMRLGAACLAADCSTAGMNVVDGEMRVGRDAAARNCGGAGFFAMGTGAMRLGPGCVAESSTGVGNFAVLGQGVIERWAAIGVGPSASPPSRTQHRISSPPQVAASLQAAEPQGVRGVREGGARPAQMQPLQERGVLQRPVRGPPLAAAPPAVQAAGGGARGLAGVAADGGRGSLLTSHTSRGEREGCGRLRRRD